MPRNFNWIKEPIARTLVEKLDEYVELYDNLLRVAEIVPRPFVQIDGLLTEIGKRRLGIEEMYHQIAEEADDQRPPKRARFNDPPVTGTAEAPIVLSPTPSPAPSTPVRVSEPLGPISSPSPQVRVITPQHEPLSSGQPPRPPPPDLQALLDDARSRARTRPPVSASRPPQSILRNPLGTSTRPPASSGPSFQPFRRLGDTPGTTPRHMRPPIGNSSRPPASTTGTRIRTPTRSPPTSLTTRNDGDHAQRHVNGRPPNSLNRRDQPNMSQGRPLQTDDSDSEEELPTVREALMQGIADAKRGLITRVARYIVKPGTTMPYRHGWTVDWVRFRQENDFELGVDNKTVEGWRQFYQENRASIDRVVTRLQNKNRFGSAYR